jgi:hypothetical protein
MRLVENILKGRKEVTYGVLFLLAQTLAVFLLLLASLVWTLR